MKDGWKDVCGFEGLYKINRDGKIIGFYNQSRKEYKRTFLDKHGYEIVALYKNKKRKWYFVHRLVAQTFIPNPQNKPQVDHINTIKTDNRVENLRWVTNFENSRNILSFKRTSENGKIQIKKAQEIIKKKIRCIETGEIFNSRMDAVRKIRGDLYNSTILTIALNNKKYKAMGFHWEYID